VNPSVDTVPAPKTLEALPSAVLRTLMYFGLFAHPLTRKELAAFCQQEICPPEKLNGVLELLLEENFIGLKDGFYFLQGNEALVDKRRERNARAESMLPKAVRYSARIAKFPFVRAVCISGSLSKGTMDKDGDVDYFIITAPRRLWVCRTLLVLYKKIFLLNSRKYFCVNYFIGTNDLHIPDRNLFTATEVSFIRPMHNAALFEAFLEANAWTQQFYPNRNALNRQEIRPEGKSVLKNLLEKMLGGSFGEWLDERFFKMTLRRWKKKFSHVDESQFDLNFRSRKNVSKHHPQGFQWTVRRRLQAAVEEFETAQGIRLQAQDWELLSDRIS